MCEYLCVLCAGRQLSALSSTNPEEHESVSQTSSHTTGFWGFWCQLKTQEMKNTIISLSQTMKKHCQIIQKINMNTLRI